MSEDTPKTHTNLYRRVTASVPLLVTVIVHVVLIAIAGYFVVSEQIIGKKKIMEASAATESVAQKQVEHRLQVARKGGGSASSSPVSASRIFSTAENALQVPAMPDLPSVGASSLSGMGFGAGLGAVGAGTGYNTGIGSGNGLGSGFMSMSFLGTTSQRASKVVFVVDVGSNLLDIRKGGFEAFKIMREEMAKLISRLPPSAEFNVVLFETGVWDERTGSLALFDAKLQPATVANKERFFEWLKPINADPNKLGMSSVGRRVPWKAKPLPNSGIDEELIPPVWARALRATLEMQPDTVFLVTGSQGRVTRKLTETELAKKKKENEDRLAEMKRDGLDPDAVNASRQAFERKARAQLDAINARLKAKGKPPLIIQAVQRIFDADFQRELKRIDESIPLDTKGWATKEGRPIWWTGYNDFTSVEYADLLMHISQLQRALLKDRAALNIFLFVGPDEQPKESIENLGKTSSRNGGKFELITTKRLKELAAREEEKK
ncbi:MAG: hypothetical protein H7067_19800 [Burkholderiales bacterium]|nr:hypothetical protein [Opitutaceae bacterium]